MSFVGFRVETQIDDRQLMDRLAVASTEILRDTGATIRRGIRSSLKYDKRSSRPGQPPRLHRTVPGKHRARGKPGKTQSESPLAKIVFSMPDPMSVVIGPMAVGKQGNVPHVIEEGGTTVTNDGKRITIEPRPFMKPVFFQETMRASALWADAI